METKHGVLSLIGKKYHGLTLHNILRAAIVRYKFIQWYIIKLMRRRY